MSHSPLEKAREHSEPDWYDQQSDGATSAVCEGSTRWHGPCRTAPLPLPCVGGRGEGHICRPLIEIAITGTALFPRFKSVVNNGSRAGAKRRCAPL